ncbi:carbohydrate kinase [Aureitalea sp. L0-47]|uniref:carbohydrate kinase family protein n=1 Tax=Aureitalea sp. L0-47 TaxID=2816962 RepID=UPI0022374F9F|nr:carbohydrate kinase [Aureitalea sp. L0-47]MCW5518621.1 carbohydrate kinase [Aureitalea sp. L0-47]
MENKRPKVVCFGEVLWDVFPDKRLLGGAPLNVALRLHSLGAEVLMISAVGKDALGSEALTQIANTGLRTSGIITSETKPTGAVEVSLVDGIASYTITEDVAWDHLEVSDELMKEVAEADALVFGSLALRNKNNRELLNTLLEINSFGIFDLNLRPPHFTDELISEMMQKAHLIKLNDEELEYVSNLLKITHRSLDSRTAEIAYKTETDSICVTLGENGAFMVQLSEDLISSHPGYKVSVKDTVGAGDSFFAGLIYELLSGSTTEQALTMGCALGALVASKSGANCEVSPDEINTLTKTN